MADTIALSPLDSREYYNVSSGAVRFKFKCPRGLYPVISLYSDKDPCKGCYKELYQITIKQKITIVNSKGSCIAEYELKNLNLHVFQEFWMQWYNDLLMLGQGQEIEPFFMFNIEVENRIRFAQFGQMYGDINPIQWIIDKSPVDIKQAPLMKLSGGNLHWVLMMVNDDLPDDAMVGGFENEPLYIIRSKYGCSLTPGKFMPYSKKAYIPWGHREYSRLEFEVLCGYDAHWVYTKGIYIPENAFVAGHSEVRNEPLYIGRAMHEGYLLVGKVHTLYGTCYLSYKGKEVEKTTYEILVSGTNSQARAVFGD